MERKLVNYLPRYTQDYDELKTIMEAEQPEIDSAWIAAKNALTDQFIFDATEYGVKRWEKMLNILPKGTDTLDERKFRIITLINQELPYTVRNLEQTLTNLCGADGYSLIVTASEYRIEVKLALENENNYTDVVNLLKHMIPANMVQVVTIMYNGHKVLMQFTHQQLSAFTHNQIRREVFN